MAADYTSENVSPLMIFFAPIIKKTPNQINFRYDGVTPDVAYTTTSLVEAEKSKELEAYEKVAKKSARLKKFMKESPADITYFEEATYYKGENA